MSLAVNHFQENLMQLTSKIFAGAEHEKRIGTTGTRNAEEDDTAGTITAVRVI